MKKVAIIPWELWREYRYQEALALLKLLTAAGTDPEKITAAMGRIEEFNALVAAAASEDRP